MAEELNNTSVNEETTEATVETTEQKEEKMYSAADVQSMIDKRVTQALQTQQKKFDKQLSLSRLDDDARAKAEKDNRIAELEEQLAQFQLEKNKSELKSVLSSRGLSAEFADIVAITEDLEASQAVIEKLDKLFKLAVKTEVEKRLAGNAPKGNGASSTVGAMTKAEFMKLSFADQSKLLGEQPELANKFLN